MNNWRNRIIAFGTKPADQFQANPNNWRQHPEKQQTAMRDVLDRLGWIGVVIENVRTGELIDGHERVWEALQNDNAEIPFIQVDLSPEEQDLALSTYDVLGHMAETDEDMLEGLLRGLREGDSTLGGLVASLASEMGVMLDAITNENPYTWKINSPHYVPTSDTPPLIGEMYDDTRTRALTAEVNATDFPEELKQFLITAAQRHTVLRFDKIAEYYAHAPAAVQRLMESSALVILDFDRAIELGFVRLTEQLAEQMGEENDGG